MPRNGQVPEPDIAISFELFPPRTGQGLATLDATVDDLDNLRRKLDAGATKAITQYCFDTDRMLRFMDRVQALGIDKPIVPGIMPVCHLGKLVSFSNKSGATVPDWLAEMFEGLDDDPETRAMVAAAVATEQCSRLIDAGFDEFHVYTLNRAGLSVALGRALRLKDAASAQSAA